MKKILSLFVVLLITTAASANPARPAKRMITLNDGTQVEVTLKGDEAFHYWKSASGQAYVATRDGQWQEITLATAQERLQTARKNRAARRNGMMKASINGAPNHFTGSKRGIVILVSFPDKPIQSTQEEYWDYFNKVGYNANGSAGSVRDYFLAQSYGEFAIDFDVVGPVTVSKSYTYYGENDDNGDDLYPATMVAEAVKLADDLGVDFSRYDWNGDGYVDQVYCIYAGYAESNGAEENTIWPHEFDLTSALYYGDGHGAVKCDGVKINTYAVSSELTGTYGNKMEGLGAAVHEFSHCLGFPDFYDTSDNGNFGMSYWDVMDCGDYLGEGYIPCGYTSYERWMCGWLTPTVLDSYTEVRDMPAISDEPVAYVIYNQANKDEYYLLENRQRKSWDAKVYGVGMLVLHVDYNATAWTRNTVNTSKSRQRMTIIPADGKCSEGSTMQLMGDVWPGSKKNTTLTNTSTPAATLYNENADGQKLLNFPITDIALNSYSGLISFNAGEKIDAIEAVTPWKQRNLTDVYDLQGRRVDANYRGARVVNGKIFLR